MPPTPITKEDSRFPGVFYKVWDEKTLKAFPVNQELINKQVLYASEPNKKTYLRKIKKEGDPGFPEGGYLLEDLISQKAIHAEIEEVCAKPQKKVKAYSQLSRKKYKKKV